MNPLRPSNNATQPVSLPAEALELERLKECERLIASQITDYLHLEANLSEDGDMASAFGISMLSQLLIGLKNPLTPEAISAIELAYTQLRYPHNYAALEECMASIPRVPEESALPGQVAAQIRRFSSPQEVGDEDPIGEALKFFARCSTQQINAHLEPLVESHPDERVRERLQEWILQACPELIPTAEVVQELSGLCEGDSMEFPVSCHARKLVALLSISPLPRAELLTIFEGLLSKLLSSDCRAHLNVAEGIVEALAKGEGTTEEISNCLRGHLGLVCSGARPREFVDEVFKYLKRFHAEELEGSVIQFLTSVVAAQELENQRYTIQAGLSLLESLSEPRSFAVLAKALTADERALIRWSTLKLDRLLAHSELPGEKGGLALAFLARSESLVNGECAFHREVTYEHLRKKAVEPAHYSDLSRTAQDLARGGYSGADVLLALKFHLSEGTGETASIKQIFAARLIAGHNSPEAEDLLFNIFCTTKDLDLKQILAESLSKKRGRSTEKLLQNLWSEDPKEVAVTIRCFKGTQDPGEAKVIALVCRGYLHGVGHEEAAIRLVLTTALDALADTPGPEVDDLFCSAITSPIPSLRDFALDVCRLTKKFERRWFKTYRPQEHLVDIAMQLYGTEGVTETGKVQLLKLLGPHSAEERVKDFLQQEFEKEQVSDTLAAALFAARASSGEPEMLQAFFTFLRRRRIDPSNSPAVAFDVGREKGPGLFHITEFNVGDGQPLGEAMGNLVGRKARVQA